MRKLSVLFVVLVSLGFMSASSARPGTKVLPTMDLSDLRKIEKMVPKFPDTAVPAIKKEFSLLTKALASAPTRQRPAILSRIAGETKWGTPERFVAYYVSAWYGVDYTKTRDYLTNATFWGERNLRGQRPFSFYEDSIILLYSLYEHNLDFKILHDILTTNSDASGGEVITSYREESIRTHPRGVLHVAALSPNGRRYVYRVIHTAKNRNDNLLDPSVSAKDLKAFRGYIKKVASDPSDPLATVANDLLKA